MNFPLVVSSNAHLFGNSIMLFITLYTALEVLANAQNLYVFENCPKAHSALEPDSISSTCKNLLFS